MIPWYDLRVDYDEDGTPVSGEIVFSHVDDKTNKVRHFAVERIQKQIDAEIIKPQEIIVPIDKKFALFAIRARGVEVHRFERVTPTDICNYPIMMAHMPGVGRDHPVGEHLIIDGIHRYCKAAFYGWSEIRAYELEPDVWEQFLVDVPMLDEDTRTKLDAQARGIPIDSRIK